MAKIYDEQSKHGSFGLVNFIGCFTPQSVLQNMVKNATFCTAQTHIKYIKRDDAYCRNY